jgi:hypothetical protein
MSKEEIMIDKVQQDKDLISEYHISTHSENDSLDED